MTHQISPQNMTSVNLLFFRPVLVQVPLSQLAVPINHGNMYLLHINLPHIVIQA